MQFLRSRVARAAVVAMLAVLIGACSDATSPTRNSGFITSAATVALPAAQTSGTIDFKTLYPKYKELATTRDTKADTTVDKFFIRPGESRIVRFGKEGHYIAIPPNVICNPSTTAYGPTEWRKPCDTLKKEIEFTIKTYVRPDGRSHADFSPDVRFDPAAPVPVSIFFAETKLVNPSRVIIPFCASPSSCVDESIGEPLLTTFAAPHPSGGFWVFRMLRHFSGYNVTAF